MEEIYIAANLSIALILSRNDDTLNIIGSKAIKLGAKRI